MAKKPRENRVPIMMSDDELTAIDDWRFENRVATRSDAVRRLCQIGLAADEHLVAMIESHIEVASAAMDVAAKAKTDDDAMRVLSGLSEFWQRFGKVRGVILPMRKAETIEAAFAELEEIRQAWEKHDPDKARGLMEAYLKVAREAQKEEP